MSDEISDVGSHTNVRYMNTPEKKTKMSKLKKKVQIAERDIRNLERRIKELTEQQGENVDSILHKDLL